MHNEPSGKHEQKPHQTFPENRLAPLYFPHSARRCHHEKTGITESKSGNSGTGDDKKVRNVVNQSQYVAEIAGIFDLPAYIFIDTVDIDHSWNPLTVRANINGIRLVTARHQSGSTGGNRKRNHRNKSE